MERMQGKTRDEIDGKLRLEYRSGLAKLSNQSKAVESERMLRRQ